VFEGSLVRRELEVVGGGLSDGLSSAVGQTCSDLKNGLSEFADSPLKATTRYLGDHWQDAVAGAAITMINPRGWGNAALMAYATRGLWQAVGKAAIDAGHSDTDVEDARAQLSLAVSHEGTAFLSSMPLTMVGGSFGKAGANAVFGKDLGAYDLITGKVKPADIGANLARMGDRLNPTPLRALVTDMDGTVGDFTLYFGRALEENVDRIHQTALDRGIQLSKADVLSDLGSVMGKERTHDFPWSLEKSSLRQKLNMTPDEFSTQVVKPFWEHMDATRESTLRPYDSVVNTLQHLKDQGVHIIVRTDAPDFIAMARARTLGLDKFADEFYPIQGRAASPQEFEHPSLYNLGEQRRLSLLKPGVDVETMEILPKSAEKPHVGPTAQRLKDLGYKPDEVAMIDDSRTKGGKFAQDLGVELSRLWGLEEPGKVKFYWAEYGNKPNAEIRHVFKALQPDDGAPKVGKVYPPIEYTAKQYSDILRLVHPYRALGQDIASSFAVAPNYWALSGYSLWPNQTDR
jgi:phosphoglycolate phosphatase